MINFKRPIDMTDDELREYAIGGDPQSLKAREQQRDLIISERAEAVERAKKTINPKDMIGVTKTPLHLVSPIGTVYASIAAYLGATKYGAWNWRGSETSASVYYSALQRHLMNWWSGEENDPTDGTPHMANALTCINIIIEGMYMGNMRDDRPPSVSLRPAMKMVEDLMPILAAKYKHMEPKHWTIADEVSNAKETP